MHRLLRDPSTNFEIYYNFIHPLSVLLYHRCMNQIFSLLCLTTLETSLFSRLQMLIGLFYFRNNLQKLGLVQLLKFATLPA
mmetsp:Transcript_9142/g.10444  ORF Transcript_9142/g.10444 Transcript_9142/m.10444 type:complete len:81 (-) Transcript_9142:201-443(-)